MDPTAAPRRSGPNWGLTFGLGCGGCLLVVVFLVAGGFFLFRAGTDAFKEVDPVARKFANHVFTGDSDSAYTMISKLWKRTSSREQFDTWVDYCRKQIGGPPTLTFTGYNLLSGTGGRRETVTYRVGQGSKTGILQVTLIRESAQIRIQSANFTTGQPATDN